MSAMSNLATDLEINWHSIANGYKTHDGRWMIKHRDHRIVDGPRLVTLYSRDPDVAGWKVELRFVELHTAIHHAMTKA